MIAATALALALLTPADRQNIDLSMAIVAHVGDSLWPNWSNTPFDIALLTADGPVFVNVEKPAPLPSFPPTLEATFPLSNGVPTIVIGEPQYTKATTPIRWSVTLIHEHFHQWQDAWPQYYSAIKALDLAPPGDKNGMWMLNYPFPYARPSVDAAYATMAHDLADAVSAIGTPDFERRVDLYHVARTAFRDTLSPAEYRYFAFQCWQEGVARYTEIAVARLASKAHATDPSFLSDAQAAALADDAAQTYGRVMQRLRSNALSDGQRDDFYAIGAGEALLLDRLDPAWHNGYLNPRMDLSLTTNEIPHTR